MASSDANMSTAQSAQKDINGAINMGREAAQAAKTVQAVASQAAAGNFAGAAISLLKDPATTKKIIAIILIPFLIVGLLMVCFLYALPTMIFEAVESFFSDLGERWDQTTYGGQDGVVWGGIKATIGSVGDIVGSAAKGIWDGLCSLFTSKEGDVDDKSETLTDSGTELHVTQQEAAERETLNRKIDACIAKLTKRSDQIEGGIKAVKPQIAEYFDSKYASTCDEWLGTKVQVVKNSLSKRDAVKLLSTYTVMTEGATKDIKLSDFMRWLGYYNEFTTARTSFNVGGPTNGVTASVQSWDGTFVPQYLFEQRKFENKEFDKQLTNFDKLSCPAVDLLLIVDCPNFEDIKPTYSIVEVSVRGSDGQMHTKKIKVGSVDVVVSIISRDIDSFSQIVGFWDGKLPKQP